MGKQSRFLYHGRHGTIREPSKIVLALAVLTGGAACAWLAIHLAGTPREYLLTSFGVVYALRTTFMVAWLLPRRVSWVEAAGDVIGVFLVLYLLVIYWAGARKPLDGLDAIAILLFLTGSVLTTGSEVARKRWKSRSENTGRLYTSGAFRYSRHINYFGELVSFAGFALATRTPWSFIIPMVMLVFFLIMHIPALEMHLRERYGASFDDYARRTKVLIPFIY